MNGNIQYTLVSDFTSTFSIDATTGALDIVALDFDDATVTRIFDVQVVATDQGAAPLATTVNVAVTLQPINEFTPAFTGTPYTETLAEDTALGTVLTTVVGATDDDSTTTGDGKIAFYIDPPSDKFEISSNGEVTLVGELNYEELVSPYEITLTVYAYDFGENPARKSASTSYVITVTNVNDVYSVCDFTTKIVKVLEDPSLNSGNLATLTCSDTEDDTTMGYAVAAVNDDPSYAGTPAFTMSSNVLQYSGGAFDYDTTNFFKVTIDVTDHATTPLTTTVEVDVFVVQSITADPTFSPASYSLSVDENQNAGTLVGNIDTTTEGNDIVYSLSGTSLFSIDPMTGEIYTAKELDTEAATSHTFTVQATSTESDLLSSGLTGYTDLSITVTIDDVNDNAPAFANDVYVVTVTEGSTATIALTTSDGDDAAPNNVIASVAIDPSYNGGTESASFVYGAGTLTINGDSGLDFDSGTVDYEIRLEVIDTGATPLTGTCTVFVKVLNDNEATPAWASATTFNVDEAQPVGTVVTTVAGTDGDSTATGDGVLRYEFTAANNEFSIGYTTGEIKTKKVFDYEATTTYSMTVRVSDLGGTPLSVDQLIAIDINDINDEQLECGTPNEAFNYRVTETTTTTAPIGTITCNGNDATAGLNTLSLGTIVISPNVAWLTATAAGTTVTISHSAAIDYESLTEHHYTMTIPVMDNAGTAPSSTVILEIDIEIENDNEDTPAFAVLPATVSIDETVPVGFSVFNASGIDGDSGDFGSLRFEITSGNVKGVFRIEEFTGKITTTTLLDRETLAGYSLGVSVYDGGALTSTAILTVNLNDINDNPPNCPPAIEAVNVQENLTNADGSFLTITCTDDDVIVDTAAVLTYTIASSLPSAPFKFDATNKDELLLKPSDNLDYETAQNFTLIVEVKDSASTHTATTTVFIKIDPVNEFDPTFTAPSYECNITESYVIGDFACAVSASDLDDGDDGRILFDIEAAGNELGKFKIDSENGEITLLNTIDVDSFPGLNNPVVFTLSISAEDQSLTSHRSATPATVVINVYDVIDASPVCDSFEELSIPEDRATPSILFDIDTLCTDTDQGEPPFTVYQILSGNSEGKFDISGSDFRLVQSLDHEASEYYNITIRVCDAAFPTQFCVTTEVLIKVDPVNECDPVFTPPASGVFDVAISEDIPIGTTIMTITASDCDNPTTDFGQFFFKMVNATADNSDVFTIDKSSGELITGKRLDYDTAPNSYIFEVSVCDSLTNATLARSSVINVTVNLLDINDNRPLFNPATYTSSVIDDIAAGTPIKVLIATDADSGNNAVITMKVTGGDPGEQFYMDGNILTLDGALDAEVVDSYKLVVEAKDNAESGQEMSSTALVNVFVSKRNNEPPTIVQLNDTQLSFPENTPIGTLLFKVEATDDDTASAVLSYTIASVTTDRTSLPAPQYQIDSTNGNVYLGVEYDYEDGKHDVIIVSVSDGTNVRSVKIEVNITNVNEHAPTCDSALLTIGYDENSPKSVVSLLETDGLVYDMDYQAAGITNAMKFKLLYASAADVFAIDPFTDAAGNTALNGRLELMTPILDFESDTNQYSIIFKVSDEDYNPTSLTSTCNLKILVQDINDNAPHFTPKSLFLEATELIAFSQKLVVADNDAGSTITACTTNASDFSVALATKTLSFDLGATTFTREYLGVLSNSL